MLHFATIRNQAEFMNASNIEPCMRILAIATNTKVTEHNIQLIEQTEIQPLLTTVTENHWSQNNNTVHGQCICRFLITNLKSDRHIEKSRREYTT